MNFGYNKNMERQKPLAATGVIDYVDSLTIKIRVPDDWTFTGEDYSILVNSNLQPGSANAFWVKILNLVSTFLNIPYM